MMKPSKNEQVQQFLEDTKIADGKKFEILQGLREVVLKLYPNASERIMYGGILFTVDDDFGGIFVYQKHVSFEFSHGYQFNDPKNFLDGKGKFRRHLKLVSLTDIENKDVEFFVQQAV